MLLTSLNGSQVNSFLPAANRKYFLGTQVGLTQCVITEIDELLFLTTTDPTHQPTKTTKIFDNKLSIEIQ